jgi:hypothetical protein
MWKLAIACAAATGCGADEPSPPSAPRFACDPNGLTRDERAESLKLQRQLAAAVSGVDELADGFGFHLDEGKLPLAALSRWVELERRCCPFFHFAIEVAPKQPPVLRLTGADGVKDFIRSELGT